MKYDAISLFSSSGIGDLGLRKNGIKTVVSCELLEDRAKLFENNFPECKCFVGDIWDLKENIINYYQTKYQKNPFLIMATPPCQGMSSNGMGKMLNDYRKGLRPKQDPRNRLIIPAIEIIKTLKPEWVILENVPTMTNTLIYDEENNLINIIDFIQKELRNDYVGEPKVIDVADYGVPQHRKRLLTVLGKKENIESVKYFEINKSFIPAPTHGKEDTLITKHWITLREAIGGFPKLRAEKGKNQDKTFNLLHKVPLLDKKKLFWIDNTPEGETAFNNQCINPKCMYKNNPIHRTQRDKDGINKASNDTPLYCEKCGELLPRPCVEDKNGHLRIMKGFTSAYKRMNWDEPASTITQNFQYACSDNKIHPDQSRVLSLYEGLKLQTITDYDYSFEINGKVSSDRLIRDTIGESVPPRVIDLICKNIIKISK